MSKGSHDRELLEVPELSPIEKRLLVDGEAKTKPNIGPVEKNSELFRKLEAFLPKLRESNEEMVKQGSGEHEDSPLELPEDHQGNCVQLDLACGLFDLHTEEAVTAAETSLTSKGPGMGKDDSNDTRANHQKNKIEELNELN